MRKNKSKNRNGITLIALVITIIVMLVLVTVSINLATNGGLFGYAGDAAKQTKEAQDDEKDWLAVDSNLSTDVLIAKYTTNKKEDLRLLKNYFEGKLLSELEQEPDPLLLDGNLLEHESFDSFINSKVESYSHMVASVRDDAVAMVLAMDMANDEIAIFDPIPVEEDYAGVYRNNDIIADANVSISVMREYNGDVIKYHNNLYRLFTEPVLEDDFIIDERVTKVEPLDDEYVLMHNVDKFGERLYANCENSLEIYFYEYEGNRYKVTINYGHLREMERISGNIDISEFDYGEIYIDEGGSYDLSLKPGLFEDFDVVSNNTSIVTIDGKIAHGVTSGSTTITLIGKESGKTKTIPVEVCVMQYFK